MASLEALWVLRFGAPGTPEGDLEGGVVVFETGRVFGGDSGFAYVGRYEVSNGEITGKLQSIRHNRHVESIFGTTDNFEVQFAGRRVSDDQIEGVISREGYGSGVLVMHRLADLP